MSEKPFKSMLEDYIKLLPLGKSISFTEAERRAGLFLEAMAKVTDWRHEFSEEKIKLLTTQTASFAQELHKAEGATITERKMVAETADEYVAAREELESVENDIAYLKAMFDIFNNAHIFYRNQAKGENV